MGSVEGGRRSAAPGKGEVGTFEIDGCCVVLWGWGSYNEGMQEDRATSSKGASA